jgi:hypothetical protein
MDMGMRERERGREGDLGGVATGKKKKPTCHAGLNVYETEVEDAETYLNSYALKKREQVCTP